MKKYYIYLIIVLIYSCRDKQPTKESSSNASEALKHNATSLIILGTIQDAGSPHIGCKKECCKDLFDNPDKNRQVVSLGLIDNDQGKKYLFEATPDISRQMKSLKKYSLQEHNELVDGIFLTHAHIGHYTGLMYLGKEATNAKQVNVYAMPRMKKYLETNGPWDQLVSNKNIVLTAIENEQSIPLTSNIIVTPLRVPHRDEYSETVGYKIKGPNKSALFIPDIDKWSKWDKNIIAEIEQVDYAFLDATFYSGTEINTRDIGEIPHPFIIESLERFKGLSKDEKSKIIFIHFNHTNPVINTDSKEYKLVIEQGFRIGKMEDVFEL